jgi:hypothetical protein
MGVIPASTQDELKAIIQEQVNEALKSAHIVGVSVMPAKQDYGFKAMKTLTITYQG